MEEQKMYDGNWWIGQLDRDETALRDGWWNYADKIVKKYLAKKSGDSDEYWVNLFWANVGILKAALYARPPKPMVERSFKDPDDNLGRVASQIIQRSLSQDLMKNVSPMSEAIKLAVEDRLIPGLGQIWLRYVPTIATGVTPAVAHPLTGEELVPEQEYEEITAEEVVCEHVAWRDFIYPPARTASEVWYVGRRLYLTKPEVEKRFGKSILARLNQTMGEKTNQDNTLPKGFSRDKIELYEIWCRKTKRVYWLSRHFTGNLLETMDDPLGLDEFYPCPMPLLATHTTNQYLPRPDYYMLKDQYDELNELNTRIVILEKALRVVGVYDKKNDELKRMLSDARENDMIPVSNWAMFSEKGGMKGAVDWFPLEAIVLVLEKLTLQKQAKIDEIYVLTGISDIMRGDTNPRETLGAQQMKASFSSARLQYLQDEIAIFVRQALIIKAEIMCKHFQDESLMEVSQIGQTTDAQIAPQAIELLRNAQMVHFKIDINEEGLALPDYARESASRQEFLKITGQFVSQAMPLIQQFPGSMPFVIQMIRWVASGLRGAGEIQGVFDQMAQAALQIPAQSPEQDTNLEEAKVKAAAEANKSKARIQEIGMKTTADAKKTAAENATDLLLVQQEGLNAEKLTHMQAATDLLQEKIQHQHRMNEIQAAGKGSE